MTISDLVWEGGGLLTGMRLPGTDILEPDVIELELGVGLRGTGGLTPYVLRRREEDIWYIGGTAGTGGGLVPMSHLGLSPTVPVDILEGWRRTVLVPSAGDFELRLYSDGLACIAE
jgi:hypothetical protein